jgi:hypothetical protein
VEIPTKGLSIYIIKTPWVTGAMNVLPREEMILKEVRCSMAAPGSA